MAYKPWEVQENLWREKCKWGNRQNMAFLASHLAERSGKSFFDTLQDLKLAEKSGMIKTNKDGTVEIK